MWHTLPLRVKQNQQYTQQQQHATCSQLHKGKIALADTSHFIFILQPCQSDYCCHRCQTPMLYINAPTKQIKQLQYLVYFSNIGSIKINNYSYQQGVDRSASEQSMLQVILSRSIKIYQIHSRSVIFRFQGRGVMKLFFKTIDTWCKHTNVY